VVQFALGVLLPADDSLFFVIARFARRAARVAAGAGDPIFFSPAENLDRPDEPGDDEY
jgi:hypothetical protein